MPSSVKTFLIIIAIAAAIAIVAFAIYKMLMPKLKEDAPTEEEALNEELARVLQPVDDAETAKQISEYKNDEEDE